MATKFEKKKKKKKQMHKSDLPSSNDYALNSHFLEEIKRRDQSKARFSLFHLTKQVTEKKNESIKKNLKYL